jgi:MYXO-CTERM domain-containing protein
MRPCPATRCFVAPGEYDAVRTVRSGSADGRISVVALEARTATILADGTGIEIGHDNHTFEGLVVDCGYGSGDCIEGGSDAIELVDLEVRRSARDCIDLRNSSDVLVEGCDIHHCVAQFDPDNNADAHGITGDSVFDLTVRDTTITLVTGDSIQLSPGRDPWGGLVVESSVLSAEALEDDTMGWSAGTVIGENAFDSKVGGGLDGNGERPTAVFRDVVATGWRGPIGNAAAFNVKEEVDFVADGVVVSGSEIAFRLRGPSQVRIQNAVVHDVDIGFRMEDDLPGPRLYNTTVGGGVERVFTDAGGEPVDPDLQNLLFLASEVPELASGDASNLAVDDSVFVDAAGHDYRLIEGSAPMDAGVELTEVTQDLDGVPRPFGDAYDIGAHEWTDMPPPEGETDTESDGGGTDGGDDGGSSGGDDGGNADSGGGSGGDGEGDGGDGGSSGATGAGSGSGPGFGDDGEGAGCGCTSGDAGPAGALWLLGLLGLRRRWS